MFKFKKLLSCMIVSSLFILSTCTNVVFASENEYFTEEELIQRITEIHQKYLEDDQWEITEINYSELTKYSRDEIESQLTDLENSLKNYSTQTKNQRNMETYPVTIESTQIISAEEFSKKYDIESADISKLKNVDIIFGTSTGSSNAPISQSMTTYNIRVNMTIDWVKGYTYTVLDVYNVSSRLYGNYLGTATWT